MTRVDLDNLTTERVNPRTRELDLLPTETMLLTINDEDRTTSEAVRQVVPQIATAVDTIAKRLKAGGSLHYFGAGTSGRLGVLDASECPPTFGVEQNLVQGHIAGGEGALTRSIEGAEDNEGLGAEDVVNVGIKSSDTVLTLSASGRTPYCIGVLRKARERGAFTVALVCNRPSPMHSEADLVIDPVVGEEVVSGSTRLKAGTAQKLTLNMISTGVMVRLGRTYGNLMVGVRATNDKLRIRAERLVKLVTGSPEGVQEALDASGWDVKTACVMLKRGLTRSQAERLLEECGGLLREALGE